MRAKAAKHEHQMHQPLLCMNSCWWLSCPSTAAAAAAVVISPRQPSTLFIRMLQCRHASTICIDSTYACMSHLTWHGPAWLKPFDKARSRCCSCSDCTAALLLALTAARLKCGACQLLRCEPLCQVVLATPFPANACGYISGCIAAAAAGLADGYLFQCKTKQKPAAQANPAVSS